MKRLRKLVKKFCTNPIDYLQDKPAIAPLHMILRPEEATVLLGIALKPCMEPLTKWAEPILKQWHDVMFGYIDDDIFFAITPDVMPHLVPAFASHFTQLVERTYDFKRKKIVWDYRSEWELEHLLGILCQITEMDLRLGNNLGIRYEAWQLISDALKDVEKCTWEEAA